LDQYCDNLACLIYEEKNNLLQLMKTIQDMFRDRGYPELRSFNPSRQIYQAFHHAGVALLIACKGKTLLNSFNKEFSKIHHWMLFTNSSKLTPQATKFLKEKCSDKRVEIFTLEELLNNPTSHPLHSRYCRAEKIPPTIHSKDMRTIWSNEICVRYYGFQPDDILLIDNEYYQVRAVQITTH
jgi:hypothetical protein